ncbi:alanine--glyoxylate aminotransferase family protein [Irregularibacter muris]|uniref:Alanine--glyoxylate aminotransferase family protein n=1 Tax=Irregularibacter muris TaxID=1796619 RepID=A0AAE3KZT2_9FIRM|nr:alanine--glyoxylate aminotransferase family protein [Irregularibacter muris]MCR1898727.1 alanine--glyoxylate aminotransferase family protein [Irregularibacter muris]
MKEMMIMTPGPTYVHEEVRAAMGKPIINPDLDLQFYEFYYDLCGKLQKLLHTQNQVLVLNGEGILGLEAACASLIEPGDKVLCIDNGIFGNGFGDFAKIYGGQVTYFKADYRKGINKAELENFIQKNGPFKIATLVHCETPSGITNPIDKICPLLHDQGIISIVDAVSSMGGEAIHTDQWKVDILLGGSQKCLSAPPGLTILSVSERAWDKISKRKHSIVGFYTNLSSWKNWYEEKWFPYTQPVSDLYALDKAVERILEDKGIFQRHKNIAEAVRKSIIEVGLELYPKESFSNTVTAMMVPEETTFEEINKKMLEEHRIMIAGSLGDLNGKVMRIGHMGENCYEEKLYLTLKALDTVLKELNVPVKGYLHKHFQEVYNVQ